MTNFDLCHITFNFLKNNNVDTVIVCAGARNAPFVFHLESEKLKTYYFFEERSAAFFALGLIKQTNKPVAVITTSGTAAAELLPAAIEAFYQGLPLILISADRPKAYRKSGAPQAIEQVGLYSHYVENSVDWDVSQSDFLISWSQKKPIHLNICFDEPLLDSATDSKVQIQFTNAEYSNYPIAERKDFEKIKHPLVIVGQISESEKSKVKEFLVRLNAPIYLESLSQLRQDSDLTHLMLSSSDILVKYAFNNKQFESIVRIGGVPTLRFWRDLEDKFKDVPVYNFTNLNFSGLSRQVSNYRLEFQNFNLPSHQKPDSIFKLDQQLNKLKTHCFENYKLAEPSLVHQLSEMMLNQPIYLGNSLPIRQWDLFSSLTLKNNQTVYANRGANGIDGQISTYLGWSEGFDISWCLIGDLTAMYDLAALALKPFLNSKNKKRIVVMNNKGGQLFKRIFKQPQFLNSHHIEFEHWAKMFQCEYVLVKNHHDLQNLKKNTSQFLIVEIQPDANQTTLFWDEWDRACNQI